MVSTRSIEHITDPVTTCFDNQPVRRAVPKTLNLIRLQVFRECDLILICVLPHQLGAVASDYRACTASHAIVAVLSSSIPTRKLQ